MSRPGGRIDIRKEFVPEERAERHVNVVAHHLQPFASLAVHVWAKTKTTRTAAAAVAAVHKFRRGLRAPAPHCGTTKGRRRVVRFW